MITVIITQKPLITALRYLHTWKQLFFHFQLSLQRKTKQSINVTIIINLQSRIKRSKYCVVLINSNAKVTRLFVRVARKRKAKEKSLTCFSLFLARKKGAHLVIDAYSHERRVFQWFWIHRKAVSYLTHTISTTQRDQTRSWIAGCFVRCFYRATSLCIVRVAKPPERLRRFQVASTLYPDWFTVHIAMRLLVRLNDRTLWCLTAVGTCETGCFSIVSRSCILRLRH